MEPETIIKGVMCLTVGNVLLILAALGYRYECLYLYDLMREVETLNTDLQKLTDVLYSDNVKLIDEVQKLKRELHYARETNMDLID